MQNKSRKQKEYGSTERRDHNEGVTETEGSGDQTVGHIQRMSGEIVKENMGNRREW